jgi:hypothetical protein
MSLVYMREVSELDLRLSTSSTYDICGLSYFLQETASKIPGYSSLLLPCTWFPIDYSLIALLYNVI